MRPLGVGVTAAIVLAGPPLYSLMEAGSISGTTALTRGLIVAGVCTIGANFLRTIIEDFQRDARARALGTVVHHPGSDGAAGAGVPGPAGSGVSSAPRGFAGLAGGIPAQGTPAASGQIIAGQTVPRSS